ncbi:MAG: hypothetical protein O2904_03220 [bacterium]|nr:hypothetical protein [bacterium]
MIRRTAKLWGNGAITLPKKWRDKWDTEHFKLEEDEMGYLVVKPIFMDDIVYYEDEGGFGLHFPNGMPAAKVYSMVKEANDRIESEENEGKL